MLITQSTKTIITYALELSEADAAEILTDAYTFADRLAEQLRAAGAVPVEPNGNGHKPHAKPGKASQLTIGRGRKTKAGRPNGEKGGPSLEKLQCPHCPRQIARKFMAMHLETKHGQSDLGTASAVKSDSTN